MKTPSALLTSLVLAASAARLAAADPLPPGAGSNVLLWERGAPGSEARQAETETIKGDSVTNVHRPSLTVFLPPAGQETGTGVVVMPGGGHRFLVVGKEGYVPARWFAAHGISAFVLKYRLAKEPQSIYSVERDELADSKRALRLIRLHASEWHVDPARLGVIGFSAGGELAAMVSLRNDTGSASAPDPVDRQSCRPNFQALIYPGGSANISPNPNTPPAFLAAGYMDRPDISEGLARAYLLFKNVGVPAELHLYAQVGHGFGLNRGPSDTWPDLLQNWLRTMDLLKAAPHGQ